VSSTPITEDGLGYLRVVRAAVTSALEGLDDYDIRRPMTPTGTNLLGVVKHLIGIEAGYLGACLGRPFPQNLPWLAVAEPNADMWATADESREQILQLYEEATTHADETLDHLGLSAPAEVPWWPVAQRRTTSGALLMRVLKDTAMHAGQLQVLRELIDGRAGSDRDLVGNESWWTDYTAELERTAASFRSSAART